jgi:hypothetical protein
MIGSLGRYGPHHRRSSRERPPCRSWQAFPYRLIVQTLGSYAGCIIRRSSWEHGSK